MPGDRFGTHLAIKSGNAVHCFELASGRILTHQAGVDALLSEALLEEPDFCGGWALRGLCQVLLARAASLAMAREYLCLASEVAKHSTPSDDEIALLSALQFAVHGGLRRAAATLENRIRECPNLILFAKLAQSMRFMAGDQERLATGVDIVLNHGSAKAYGRSYMLGCLAFAKEELGNYLVAEELGLEAVSNRFDDAWAMHAVSHVHEMTGRCDYGLEFIERHRSAWSNCNNFALHLSWHAALFHLEKCQFETVLGIFDSEVWPKASEDFRDISNAVSLLCRLEFFGIPVGSRWRTVAEAAAAHIQDRTYTFACLHNLTALVAAGREAEAETLFKAMKRSTAPGNDQEHVMRTVGRPLASILMGQWHGRTSGIDTLPNLETLAILGGSVAQRDLFLHVLACDAAKVGDTLKLKAILSFRSRFKVGDQFSRAISASYSANLPITA